MDFESGAEFVLSPRRFFTKTYGEMIMKTVTLMVWFLFVLCLPARAEVVSIGSAIINGLMAIGAAGMLPAMSAPIIGRLILGKASPSRKQIK